MDTIYEGKPFTADDREDTKVYMEDDFDEKRTLCNVIRLMYKCSHEEGYNLFAIRELALEAMWMGKRMTAKMKENNVCEIKLKELDNESQTESFGFGAETVVSKKRPHLLSLDIARGNWD